jgi:hypothetical protein
MEQVFRNIEEIEKKSGYRVYLSKKPRERDDSQLAKSI